MPHDWLGALQATARQLGEIPECEALLRRLGIRPAVEGQLQRGRGVGRRVSGGLSIEKSQLSPRELGGVERTGDLSRLCPADLALLASSRRCNSGESARKGGMPPPPPTFPSLRLHLLAKIAERQLIGYAVEGWAEASRSPSHRFSRLPRQRGGPLVLCLDTSHSMVGGRGEGSLRPPPLSRLYPSSPSPLSTNRVKKGLQVGF